jgi:LPS export ABC transporter protein LptC
MHDVSYLETDVKGFPINRLHAAKVVHHVDNDEYIFTSPNLKILDSSGKLWQIHSAFGKSTNKETTINLWGNVDITELANKINIQELELKTDSLDYYRDEKYAVTNDPLTIIQLGNTIKSTGARLDFQKGVLQLLSKVEGQYVAEK